MNEVWLLWWVGVWDFDRQQVCVGVFSTEEGAQEEMARRQELKLDYPGTGPSFRDGAQYKIDCWTVGKPVAGL